MNFFSKKNDDQLFEELPDLLIVFDNDKQTSDVCNVTSIDEESVTAVGRYKVPLGDCEITNSREGRNFFYRAPSQSVDEVKRLARLEKSLVLNQITSFKPPVDTGGVDFAKLSLLIVCILLIVVMGIGSCAG